MTFSPPGFRSPRPNHFSFPTDDLPRLTPPAAPEQAGNSAPGASTWGRGAANAARGLVFRVRPTDGNNPDDKAKD
jgi:hypothetical protein